MGDDYTVVADLEETDSYLFPPVLAAIDLRPDPVIFSEEKQEATLIKRTILFETNVGNAQQRKQSKYQELADEVEANGFDVLLITVEVSSRGFVCLDGFHQL